MSTTSMHFHTPPSTTAAGALVPSRTLSSLIATLLLVRAWVRAYRLGKRAKLQHAMLNDRMLTDIGLSRYDIGTAARESIFDRADSLRQSHVTSF
jgi:uncharacterized protein YjiS (DUF1127 family)